MKHQLKQALVGYLSKGSRNPTGRHCIEARSVRRPSERIHLLWASEKPTVEQKKLASREKIEVVGEAARLDCLVARLSHEACHANPRN